MLQQLAGREPAFCRAGRPVAQRSLATETAGPEQPRCAEARTGDPIGRPARRRTVRRDRGPVVRRRRLADQGHRALPRNGRHPWQPLPCAWPPGRPGAFGGAGLRPRTKRAVPAPRRQADRACRVGGQAHTVAGVLRQAADLARQLRHGQAPGGIVGGRCRGRPWLRVQGQGRTGPGAAAGCVRQCGQFHRKPWVGGEQSGGGDELSVRR
ncbi:hypothetical protein D9M71_378940 [compost metagenome]